MKEDAAIIEARANVNQAQREYDRYKALADRGVAPQVMLEQAETGLGDRARVAASGAGAAR